MKEKICSFKSKSFSLRVDRSHLGSFNYTAQQLHVEDHKSDLLKIHVGKRRNILKKIICLRKSEVSVESSDQLVSCLKVSLAINELSQGTKTQGKLPLNVNSYDFVSQHS